MQTTIEENKNIQLEHDLLLDISNVENYTNRNVTNERIYFSEFVQKLQKPVVTKQKSSAGGFVGGWVQDVRNNENVKTRSLITLDIDEGNENVDIWGNVESYSNFSCVMYSTHNSTLESPRYRLIIPLKYPIAPGEYKPIAKYIADLLNIEVDHNSFTISQLMNYPTCEDLDNYEFYYRDLPFFDNKSIPKDELPEEEEAPIAIGKEGTLKEGLKKSPSLTDEEVIKIASRAMNKKKFLTLFEKGDTQTFHNGDDSSADQGLANILAFYTQDPEQLERLMMQSALYRAKWDKHSDYLMGENYTIEKAINGLTETFQKFELHVNESSISLKEALQTRRFEELERMLDKWVENESKGRRPSTISPIRCAIILPEYVEYILFDLEENTRIAMYQPDQGIYTRNTTLIKRVISWLEPKINNNRAEEVIYHLTNRAEVRDPTVSRYLIPVENGIFNLETKQLEAFTPEYVFTTKIETPYVETPHNPVINDWDIEKWLDSIACGDKEITNLLWQVINDSLNGNYSRKKAIFLVGDGNNGKGTFQELITNLIGLKNVATLKVNEFEERFRLSVIEGKTVIIGDDVPANVYIDDSSNFNSVATGDVVSVEFKNKQPYNTTFRCSVIQSTNGMPKFRNKTNGTIRRVLIVPFNADFNGEVENFNIKDEYIKDKKVLQYVLYKTVNMDFERFDIPESSKQELEMFKQDNDPVLDFKLSVFDEWNIPEVPMYIVYESYKMFCHENGFKPLANRTFHNQFKKYLGSVWIDGQKRFRYDELLPHIGDLDLMGIGFPDEQKPQKTYVKV